jgi:hypothetical protein
MIMHFRTLIFTAVFLASGATQTRAALLFDGSLGTTPTSQGWSYLAIPPGPVPVIIGNVTQLDTTSSLSTHAGFFRGGIPTLDRIAGFTMQIDAKVYSETHVSNDRAGFSIIVLSSDLNGIELGFWPDRIWAQSDSPLFQHAEEGAFNTTAAVTSYQLDVLGSTYSLSVAGSTIVTGALRNYSAFGYPYNQPSFIFIGDDTGSASTKFDLAYVATVPEPQSLMLIVLAGLALAGAYCRRR